MSNGQDKKGLRRVGAGWFKRTPKGGYISFQLKLKDVFEGNLPDGVPEAINFGIFKNTRKTAGSNQPDYIALVFEKRDRPVNRPVTDAEKPPEDQFLSSDEVSGDLVPGSGSTEEAPF